MNETLQGKLIIRKGKATSNNKESLLVFGVLTYSGDNNDIEDVYEYGNKDLKEVLIERVKKYLE